MEKIEKYPDNKKILYIEDDKYARDIVKRALSNNYQVDLCDNAESALQKLKMVQYDGILIDINLGYGVNGVQIFEQIKLIKGYEKIPVIAITAFAADSDREEFLSRGFSDYLAKPFSLKDLINMADKFFRN